MILDRVGSASQSTSSLIVTSSAGDGGDPKEHRRDNRKMAEVAKDREALAEASFGLRDVPRRERHPSDVQYCRILVPLVLTPLGEVKSLQEERFRPVDFAPDVSTSPRLFRQSAS